jgi:hypothetical protein
MNFLKLNSNQYIELVPRCNCSLHDAITETIAFITDNGIKGADLIVDGYTMGIYPEDFKGRQSQFIHELQQEYDNYKKLKSKIPNP